MSHLMQSQKAHVNFLLPPRAAELHLAQKALWDHRRQLRDVRGQIERLRKEERLLEEEEFFCEAVLSPVRRIPEDVLCKIFLHCLPTSTQRLGSIDPSMAPVVLTHVCRRWRIVAADFSPLWKIIWLCPQPSTVGTPEATEHLFEVLQRSKSAPFSLQIDWPCSDFRWNLDPRFLARFSPALTRLTLLFQYHPSAFTSLTPLPPGSFPRLERLIISLPRYRSESMYEDIGDIVAFKDAPCLNHVAINDWFFDKQTGTIKIDLPWPQLSHFAKHHDEYGNATTTSIFLEHHLPKCSSSLRYLALPAYDGLNWRNDGAEVNLWPQLPTIYLGNLESFTIQIQNMNTYPWFFDKLECPRLKSLRIEGSRRVHRSYDSIRQLWRTLSRFSGLVHLSVDVGRMWTPLHGLPELFDRVPNIQTLDITADDEVDSILGALQWVPCGPSHQVLPRLRTLIVRVMETDDTGKRVPSPFQDEDPSLETFLRSRTDPRFWSAEDRIKKVVIYASDLVDQSPIQEFIDDGLVFQTYTVDPRRRDGWIEDHPYVHDWPELQGIS